MCIRDRAFNPTVEPFRRYSEWKSADDVEWGRRVERGQDYDLIFGERPDNIPENDLEQAFNLWNEIWDLDDENLRERALATFDRVYPIDGEVGQYIRRQTNRRRVPVVLLRQLANYTRARGVMASACLLYTSPSPRDRTRSRMPSSA